MNNTFSTSTTINDEYMVFPYNDRCSSLLPFSPSSSINDILIHHTSNNNQFLQAPSPFPHQFQFVPDFSLLGSLLPQNNGHNDNQIISNPLNSPIGDQPNIELSETTTHIEDSQRISGSQDPKVKKGKKPSRTDRHSKIKTAKGTRDRRMRLSLDVAKELFGLQDMLGFDKASKTVEWLLTQAKPEIMKIAKTLPHQFNHGCFSSGDESPTPFAIVQEPALGSIDTSSNLFELASMWTDDDRSSNINTTTETRGNTVDGRSMRGKRKRLQPRTPILKKLSKDARAKARERAKNRTKEKMMTMRRSQAKGVVEEEAHGRDEVIQNNINNDSFVATPYEEEIKELSEKNRFAVCNELVMNQEHHIMEGSYDIIKKLNSSFPMLNHHRTQGGAGSIEQQQQQQFMDRHHFFQEPRNFMYNYQNMC